MPNLEIRLLNVTRKGVGGGRRGKNPRKDSPALSSFSSVERVSSGPELRNTSEESGKIQPYGNTFLSPYPSSTLLLFRSPIHQIPQHREAEDIAK